MHGDTAEHHISDLALQLLRKADNPAGRAGWIAQEAAIFDPPATELVRAGLAVRKRLGGYPGITVTQAGRDRIAKERVSHE